ncbi:leucine-rich repeat-containing protein 46 [Alligator sinensis]|uniref:Leucine-rich repeat-containing protein 46 n=1 Tax=Alligator sinensis TaxID=38654 RepID=A0A1U7RH25_ALLSI|nr:leucine-rich repeat-containing protein 46 [Alligator sinensis]
MGARGLQPPPQEKEPRPRRAEEPQAASMALMTPTTIRLDRKNIHAIENLQGGGEVHSLYLQQNQIEKIENLSCLPNLRFLSLAGNRIRTVENLHELQQLQFLDLSQNQIETLDADELPQSLLILDLTGNGCTNQDGYRELVLGALPHLLELDNQTVSNRKNSAPAEEEEEDKEGDDGAAVDTDSEEDYDISKLIGPFTVGKDFFADLHWELTSRSQRRREEVLKEHQVCMMELAERQSLMQPTGHPSSVTWKDWRAVNPMKKGGTQVRSSASRPLEPQLKPRSGPLSSTPKPARQHSAADAPQKAPNKTRTQFKPPKEKACTVTKTTASRAKK